LKTVCRNGTLDHDPWFRSLAISASPTLFAFGSEAPPLHCFRHGYGIFGMFRELLVKTLCDACDISTEKAGELVDELCEVGSKFGLQVQGYSSKYLLKPVTRLGGQMLQIFIAAEEVNKLVYHCRPYGVPIGSTVDVRAWLKDPRSAATNLDGQVRILFNPEVFVDTSKTRLFHYCGDWEFLGGDANMTDSRAAFVLEMRRVLAPVLRRKDTRFLLNRLKHGTGDGDEGYTKDPTPPETAFFAESDSKTTKVAPKASAKSGRGGRGKKR